MCNYLLAVDIEMNVLPGYEFASWDQGYGDMAAQPDLATIRSVPWLDKTALVLCDLLDEDDGRAGRGRRPAASCNARSSGPRPRASR